MLEKLKYQVFSFFPCLQKCSNNLDWLPIRKSVTNTLLAKSSNPDFMEKGRKVTVAVDFSGAYLTHSFCILIICKETDDLDTHA